MKFEEKKLPKHIAFIIDGNGRWAKKRGLPRMIGHKYGFKNLLKVIEDVYNMGIPYMSVYAFSQENWNRPKEEVDGLMTLFRAIFEEKKLIELKNDTKFIFSGDMSALDEDIYQNSIKLQDETKNNTKFLLNLCINYGGRQEILRAVNNIISDGIKNIDSDTFEKYLYTAGIPDPDFVIRTSGENRTSNFLPYQITYSELYFPKIFWPDFNKKMLEKSLKNYIKRDRRFGVIKGK